MVENQTGKFDSLSADYWCNSEVENSPQIPAPAGSKGFNASGFSLLSWNIQKENREGWENDFVRLSQNADILIIQEAFLTAELRRLLNRRPYYWHLVIAFEYQDVKTGVLTAATIAPDFLCPLRATEPLIGIPKTILITRYPLANTHHSLTIANIHMINFAPHISAFHDQARQMTEILVNHQLEPADFKTDLARKVFGYTVDRIYYRGLTLEEALVIEVTSSDHNPLLVRFRLNGDG
jgi:endonuclease/exonuclease/phosphatase (EEP) superfamily protein YafD